MKGKVSTHVISFEGAKRVLRSDIMTIEATSGRLVGTSQADEVANFMGEREKMKET